MTGKERQLNTPSDKTRKPFTTAPPPPWIPACAGMTAWFERQPASATSRPE